MDKVPVKILCQEARVCPRVIENSIFHSIKFINQISISPKTCSKTSFVKTIISPTNPIVSPLKPTAPTEAKNALLISP